MARKKKPAIGAYGSATWDLSRDVVDVTTFGSTAKTYLVGNSGQIQITGGGNSSAPLTGYFSSGGSFWFDEQEDLPTNQPRGFMRAIRKDLGEATGKPSGVLMHGLTWFELIKHAENADEPQSIKVIDNTTGYVFGIPVRTSWEMPEWEWVFAREAKPISVATFKNWTLDDIKGRPAYADHKSNSIKSRARK
jgi:hypothetical protein